MWSHSSHERHLYIIMMMLQVTNHAGCSYDLLIIHVLNTGNSTILLWCSEWTAQVMAKIAERKAKWYLGYYKCQIPVKCAVVYRRTGFSCKNLIVNFSRVHKLLIHKLNLLIAHCYVQFAQTQLLNSQCS